MYKRRSRPIVPLGGTDLLENDRLSQIVHALASRPGHEPVRFNVTTLLVDGLGADHSEVRLEMPIPEVRGRVDALVGRTVFEFKRDMRRERRDAEGQLERYLTQKETETGEHYVGIATDGAVFAPYEMRDGGLRPLPEYRTNAENPRDLLLWLSTVVAVSDQLKPDPDTVRRELGKGSFAWQRASQELRRLWAAVADHPEVATKRALWGQLLERVYGSPVGDDDLFFQHTYLTAVAKTMAIHVLGLPVPAAPDILSGRPFEQAGIYGVAESDFFDWVLAAPGGAPLIERIALQAGRFRLADVQTDVLKGLYESLIDPAQRHDLGEYYTPDWLASRMCDAAIADPLNERVLDPACGSGTFLFHAVRRFLRAADAAGMDNADALTGCCTKVLGIDVHPVAVQIARVTYVLALGDRLTAANRPALTLPVYLGDSMQWNTEPFLAQRDVLIEVPPVEEGDASVVLHFPGSVAADPATFDRVISRMLEMSDDTPAEPADALVAWLAREGLADPPTREVLAETYSVLAELRGHGRDHIWGFAARNLVRPIWLAQQQERPDVIVGNPPWLSYRYMTREVQSAFRSECQELRIWVGGKVATHQDLSAYFFVRCAELYLRPGGHIAFVMPYAAMTRQAFAGFRNGAFPRQLRARGKGRQGTLGDLTTLKFTNAWALTDAVQPLFPVPSCVLFAERGSTPTGIAATTVETAAGRLPRRDASATEADGVLTWTPVPWPTWADDDEASPYRDRFHQGATIVPRLLSVVERVSASRLGTRAAAPLVRSRRTSQEKPPWKELSALEDNVEQEFLRPLYLGESVAPFRLLYPLEAVIPWHPEAGMMDAEAATAHGFPHLASWMRHAEELWAQHGRGRLSLLGQWDYYGKLSVQLPPSPLRVVFAASGTIPAAAVLHGSDAVVEHACYWAAVASEEEAGYLVGILNSETARSSVEHLQARGQWGARHFDKVLLSLPIPLFDPDVVLHQEIAAEAARAVAVASAVPLSDGMHFIRARREIRAALAADGVSERIDHLVAALLAP